MLERVARCKHSSVLGQLIRFKINAVLLLQSIKLECYITLDCKGLPGANTVAYYKEKEVSLVSIRLIRVAKGLGKCNKSFDKTENRNS
jgi:hypothetical protein